MLIDITGHITELHGENGFKIKVTNDRVYSREFSDLQVSKEVSIYISPDRYPTDGGGEFKLITGGDEDQRDKRDRINKFRYLSNTLSMGDRVSCAVFIVDAETRSGVTTYTINRRPKDVKTYAESDLWLCPYEGCLKRLKVDSRESLKVRKQWRYTCLNRKKCEKITGSEDNKYKDKPWINKNPKIIRPIIWGIWIKTKVSNLWERLAGQGKNKSTTINTIVTVIAIVVAIVIAIWFR